MDAKRILTWIIAAIPLVMTIVMLPFMADRVPAHYDWHGVVDRYDAKYLMLVFPFIILIIALLRELAPRWGRHDDGATQVNLMVVDKMLMPVVLVLALLNCVTLWLAATQVQNIYQTRLPIPQLILAGVNMLFVVMGNLMPKTKPNWYVGIRMPWTVNSPEVWYSTHRFAGFVMTIWGIIGLLLTWCIPTTVIVVATVVGGTLGMVVIMVIYSYIVYRRHLRGTVRE